MKKLNKTILFFCAALATIAMIAVYSGCKKDSDDSTSTPSGTCSDGIQNQGETGVDCGGPCTACSQLCNGNGSSLWWPIDSGRSWSYSSVSSGSPEEYRVCDGTIVYDSNAYYHIVRTDSVQTMNADYYYRYASNGDLMVMYNSNGPEFLFVPANPALNQSWPFNGTRTAKVTSLTASVTTAHCTYSNLLKLDILDSTGAVVESYYLKKGLGLVDWWYYADMKLVAVDL